jgi:cell division septum initiation protein DivIVA
MHEVARLHMQGNNPTDIASLLGMKRTEVKRYINDWQLWLKQMAESNSDIKDRIFNLLFEIDQHYALVIKEAWDTVEQADTAGQLSNKTAALKLIAQVNKDRAGMFQAAGINNDTELAEQLARTEEQHEQIMQMLRDVTANCPNCKLEIRRRLAQINSEAEVIEIERDAG